MTNTQEISMTTHSTDSLMTAVVQDRYGSADVLHLRTIERPRPRADEVIVRVHAAGVDFGVWHLMEGMPYAVRLGTGLRRPRNPVRGLELAGCRAPLSSERGAGLDSRARRGSLARQVRDRGLLSA